MLEKRNSIVRLILSDFFFFGGGATPLGLQDLSLQARDQSQGLAVKAQNPNHWTASDSPTLPDFKIHYKTSIIKLCGIGTITDILINGIALSPEINLHINGH